MREHGVKVSRTAMRNMKYKRTEYGFAIDGDEDENAESLAEAASNYLRCCGDVFLSKRSQLFHRRFDHVE